MGYLNYKGYLETNLSYQQNFHNNKATCHDLGAG